MCQPPKTTTHVGQAVLMPKREVAQRPLAYIRASLEAVRGETREGHCETGCATWRGEVILGRGRDKNPSRESRMCRASPLHIELQPNC